MNLIRRAFLSLHELELLLNSHIAVCNTKRYISDTYANRGLTLRNTNFPEEISENLVCHILHRMGHCVKWNKLLTKVPGDITVDGHRCEVKAFSSTGPSSFGAKETWNTLYFVDATAFINRRFICYRVNLSNSSPRWNDLYMNEFETYGEQANRGIRPRINFNQIKEQLENDNVVEVIFNGTIDCLRENNQ